MVRGGRVPGSESAMSWWVSLDGPDGSPLDVEAFEEGGTYMLGGSTEADLNVTYNYGPRFREAWDGVGFREALDGKRAAETVALLEAGVKVLGTAASADYWDPTPGNAGCALARLLAWARQHPDGVWSVR